MTLADRVAEMDFEDQVLLWRAVRREDAKAAMRETVMEVGETEALTRIIEQGLDNSPIPAYIAVLATEYDRLWALASAQTSGAR